MSHKDAMLLPVIETTLAGLLLLVLLVNRISIPNQPFSRPLVAAACWRKRPNRRLRVLNRRRRGGEKRHEV